MKTINVSRAIKATPEQVWAIITDLEGCPAVITAIDDVDVLTEGPFAVGTTWRETRTMFGKAATEVMTIAAVEPEESYLATAESNGMHYNTEFRLEPTPDGTRLQTIFSGESTTFVGKLMSPILGLFLTGAMTKALAADLADIATAAEAAH